MADKLRERKKAKGRITLADVRQVALHHCKSYPQPPSGCADIQQRETFIASPKWCSAFRKNHRFKTFKPKLEKNPSVEGSAALRCMLEEAEDFWNTIYSKRKAQFRIEKIANIDEMPLP